MASNAPRCGLRSACTSPRSRRITRVWLSPLAHPTVAFARGMAVCTKARKPVVALCLGIYPLCALCVLCRAGAVFTALWRLRARGGGRDRHRVGGALCHRFLTALFGTPARD